MAELADFKDKNVTDVMITSVMDPNRPDWAWVNEDSIKFLRGGYLFEGETIQMRVDEIAEMTERRIGEKGLAKKARHVIARGWFSPSSPVWSSAGREDGLPISCNNSYFGDSMELFADKVAEMMIMTKHGAGTSAWLGDIRPNGSKIRDGRRGTAYGPCHYSHMIESVVRTTSQGIRNGAWAAWFNVDHKDIETLLTTFQSDDRSLGDTPFGITIPDYWMDRVIEYSLTGCKEYEPEARLWLRILKKKIETGYPYLMFSDTANRYKPEVYKDLMMRIFSSNLCSEIMLPSNEKESFVCDLGSMNVLYYHEWKDTDAVATAIKILDAVMSEYIEKTRNIKHLQAARRFAIRHRALGLGVLGLHSLYQFNGFAVDSAGAYKINKEIFETIEKQALEASAELAETLGEPTYMKGRGRRNTTVMAIAPTKSSSSIFGYWLSQGIQPFTNNANNARRAKGWYTFRNPFLERDLSEIGMNTESIWEDILIDSGSIQNIPGIPRRLKEIYKTFREIDQFHLILQAAHRQINIDQGQSLNLSYDPESSTKEMSRNYIAGYRLNVKSFYYQNNKKLTLSDSQKAAKEIKALRSKLNIETENADDDFGAECLSCSA